VRVCVYNSVCILVLHTNTHTYLKHYRKRAKRRFERPEICFLLLNFLTGIVALSQTF